MNLKPGDPVHMQTFENHPTILGGEPGDLVMVAVPPGTGGHAERLIRRTLLLSREDLGYLRTLDDIPLIEVTG